MNLVSGRCRSVREGRLNDDTSVVVVDFLPKGTDSFQKVVQMMAPHVQKVSSQGFLGCFGPPEGSSKEHDSRDVTGPGHLDLLSSVDCLQVGASRAALATESFLKDGSPDPHQ